MAVPTTGALEEYLNACQPEIRESRIPAFQSFTGSNQLALSLGSGQSDVSQAGLAFGTIKKNFFRLSIRFVTTTPYSVQNSYGWVLDCSLIGGRLPWFVFLSGSQLGDVICPFFAFAGDGAGVLVPSMGVLLFFPLSERCVLTR